jgi:hypothetical protein
MSSICSDILVEFLIVQLASINLTRHRGSCIHLIFYGGSCYKVATALFSRNSEKTFNDLHVLSVKAEVIH